MPKDPNSRRLVKRCAIVQQASGGKLTLQIPNERCTTCPGYCLRINRRHELHVAGDLPVGTRVMVAVSASALSAATCVTFGLPLCGILIPLIWWENGVASILGLTFGIGMVMCIFKLGWWTTRLEPRIEQL